MSNTPPGQDIKLHIGGREQRAGWSILDVNPGPKVDFVGNCIEMPFLKDNSCSEVYASHVMEHLGYDNDLERGLCEIHRVLKPGGRVRISVPDMDILCKLFVHPRSDFNNRYLIMRMLFGGRTDAYDVHLTGLNYEFLSLFMRRAGFPKVTRVAEFNEFTDSSKIVLSGHLISLNVEAFKP